MCTHMCDMLAGCEHSGPSRNLCVHGVLVTTPPISTHNDDDDDVKDNISNQDSDQQSKEKSGDKESQLLDTTGTTYSERRERRERRERLLPGAARGTRDRISLNLRFGVHTAAQAFEHVDSHWK